jgi:hypothetical protein
MKLNLVQIRQDLTQLITGATIANALGIPVNPYFTKYVGDVVSAIDSGSIHDGMDAEAIVAAVTALGQKLAEDSGLTLPSVFSRIFTLVSRVDASVHNLEAGQAAIVATGVLPLPNGKQIHASLTINPCRGSALIAPGSACFRTSLPEVRRVSHLRLPTH